MIDAVTQRRWEREDAWDDMRRAMGACRPPTCPECGTLVHHFASVLDSADALTCTACYTVFPVPEGD